mmetsp:Transcript_20841/g.65557  ORF Transcript_20841/g.65557 Transcript_20841/m.65557 type:complete len:211 (-) Transcript_20841:298-930(-)
MHPTASPLLLYNVLVGGLSHLRTSTESVGEGSVFFLMCRWSAHLSGAAAARQGQNHHHHHHHLGRARCCPEPVESIPDGAWTPRDLGRNPSQREEGLVLKRFAKKGFLVGAALSLSLLESQSMPRQRPSPRTAQAGTRNHSCRKFLRASTSTTRSGLSRVGRSCLLAKTRNFASRSWGSSASDRSSSLARSRRAASAESTTKMTASQPSR